MLTRVWRLMDNIRRLKYTFATMVGIVVLALFILASQRNQVETAVYDFDDDNLLGNTPTICLETRGDENIPDVPIIYFITPTYPRREQIAELTRLGQTLMHVRNLHWIVANDDKECNPFFVKLLGKFGIPLTIMATPMPKLYRQSKKGVIPRGVANRRGALTWLRKNAKSGVFYFGDDDNTFDLDLFEQIRYTKKVSMFPVGLIGEFAVSSPVIHEGKVVGFFDSWPAGRKFAVDMAGFAVSVNYFLEAPEATMPYKAGHEEDVFLRSLGLKLDDIEPLANNCTQILVWHTQTKKTMAPTLHLVANASGTSLDDLLNGMFIGGIASFDNSKSGSRTYYVKGGKNIVV